MPYINSWCRIRNRQMMTNGQTVFEAPGADDAAFLVDAYRHLNIGYPKFYKMDRLCQLGFLAAEAVLTAQPGVRAYPPEAVGIVLANRHSSLDTDVRYQETLSALPSPALFVYTLANIVAGEICIRHGFKGENTFFIFDRYDIPFLNDYIDQLLEQDAAGAVIGGWVDAWPGQNDAFIYLVEKKRTPGSIIHDQQTIRDLYGTLDAGS